MKTLPTLLISGLVVLQLTSGCAEKPVKVQLTKSDVTISGRILHNTNTTQSLRIAVHSVLGLIHKTVVIDTGGNFSTSIEITNPQNLHLYYKRGMAILYLEPNDSVYVELDQKSFDEEQFPLFRITGSNHSAKVTSEIMHYMRYKNSLKPFYPEEVQIPINEYYVILEKEICLRDSLLEVYSNENATSKTFETWAKFENKYDISNYLVDYTFMNPNHVENVYDKRVFPINDNAIVSGIYNIYLESLAFYSYLNRDSGSVALVDQLKYKEAYSNALKGLRSEEPAGISRDIMSYRFMLSLYDKSINDFNTLVDEAELLPDNQIIRQALIQMQADHETQVGYDITTLDYKDKSISGDFWKNLKAKYDNQVLYVDLWTSSCGICRREIPYSNDLQSQFLDKEVVFVNLCLSSDSASWEQIIDDYDFHGNHYILNNLQSALLRDKIMFKGFPTYMIVDKNGILVNKEAHRPSTGDLVKQQIQSYL